MTTSRRVFVAYPWNLYEERDTYKSAFTQLEKALDVKFVFAEERVSTGHVLEKIIDMINDAAFGIYDVSSWNANVTLEYGVARGLNAKAYIAFNPTKTDVGDVPSDVAGYDRLQYSSLAELSTQVSDLVAQVLGTSKAQDDPLEGLGALLMAEIKRTPGRTVSQLAASTGLRLDLVKLLLQRTTSQWTTKGATRGTKYYPA